MTEIEFTIPTDSLENLVELAKVRKSTISEEVNLKIEFNGKALNGLSRLARINDCTRREMLTRILKKEAVN